MGPPFLPSRPFFSYARHDVFLASKRFKMVYKRFVQIGRVVLIKRGACAGKLATVVNVIDQNRVFIDGPTTSVPRQSMNIKDIDLTPITVDIHRDARQSTLVKAIKKADVETKWNATAWAKKLQSRNARAGLNDFGRFKVMVARKKRAVLVNSALKTIKKQKK